MALITLSRAHFVAWYMELNGTVIKPPIEVVLMNSPALFHENAVQMPS